MNTGIYKKMAAVTAELGRVKKNIKLQSYKAVSEGDVLAAVKPLEEKYGIYSYPEVRTTEQILCNDKFILRIKVLYRFVDIEDGSSIVVESYGDGVDSLDKAPGKAMTYADKYALMKAYKIETGDDPDYVESPKSPKCDTFEKEWNNLSSERQTALLGWISRKWGKNSIVDLNDKEKEIILGFMNK